MTDNRVFLILISKNREFKGKSYKAPRYVSYIIPTLHPFRFRCSPLHTVLTQNQTLLQLQRKTKLHNKR